MRALWPKAAHIWATSKTRVEVNQTLVLPPLPEQRSAARSRSVRAIFLRYECARHLYALYIFDVKRLMFLFSGCASLGA
jgi:hypothetical protein